MALIYGGEDDLWEIQRNNMTIDCYVWFIVRYIVLGIELIWIIILFISLLLYYQPVTKNVHLVIYQYWIMVHVVYNGLRIFYRIPILFYLLINQSNLTTLVPFFPYHVSGELSPIPAPILTPSKRDKEKDIVCSICLAEFEDEEIGRLVCDHSYHVACIQQWLNRGKKTCPMCGTVPKIKNRMP